MSDENPYRFSGASDEPHASAPDERDLTQDDLLSIDFGRRALAGLIVLSTATLTATIGFVLLSIVFSPTWVLGVQIAGVLCALTYPLLFLSGLQLTPHLQRRFGALHSLGLLIPCFNVFVAWSILQDATRTLIERGVRPGWLESDFPDDRRYPRGNR